MMHDIDCHVLTHSGTKPEWLGVCLDSLKDEPCNVFLVEGEEYNVAAGRRYGYSLGNAPYASFVDSDDYVLPGAFAACEKAMRDGAKAVCTLERHLVGDVLLPELVGGHHMVCYERGALTHTLKIIPYTMARIDHLVRAKMRPRQLGAVGYVWRIHDGGVHKEMR